MGLSAPKKRYTETWTCYLALNPSYARKKPIQGAIQCIPINGKNAALGGFFYLKNKALLTVVNNQPIHNEQNATG